jgi:glutamine phosphoribosylpyrophosphate amidotransferase
MCAIIGCCLNAPTQEQIDTLKRVFLESQIRGKHATGLTVLKNGKGWSFVQPLPAEEFVKQFEWSSLLTTGTLRMIGHCRYSTSDLRYNQPLQEGKLSIVHNGVISQESPEFWSRYGLGEMRTQNDSELLLKAVLASQSPLDTFPDASISALELHDGGKMVWYHNSKRPMWSTTVSNGKFITSTKDIAIRSGLKNPEPVPVNTVYTA